MCCVFVSYFYILYIFKMYFHFFSGQLLVLLSLAVRLALCCLSVVHLTTFSAINDLFIYFYLFIIFTAK